MSGVVDPRVLALGLKPKQIARLERIGMDEEFGRIVAAVRPPRWPMIIPAVISLGFFFFAIVVVVGMFTGAHIPRGPGQVQIKHPLGLALFLTGLGSILGYVTQWGFRRFSVEYRFFERGVTYWWKGVDKVRVSYLDVRSLGYAINRQDMKGVYVGTVGTVVLEYEPQMSSKKLKLGFSHREKAKGILRRRFEGVDPMDVVRDLVAESVAERMALEIAERGETPWTGPVTFTQEGLRVKKLIGGASLMEYARIDRLGFNYDSLVLFEEGHKRGGATMAVNGMNFWPGFVLFQRLMTPRGGAEEIDEAEFEEEGD